MENRNYDEGIYESSTQYRVPAYNYNMIAERIDEENE